MTQEEARARLSEFLDQIGGDELEEVIANLEPRHIVALHQATGAWWFNLGSILGGGGNRVTCDLPHQGCVVLRSRTVSCTNGHVFCKKHSLVACPECGQSVA